MSVINEKTPEQCTAMADIRAEIDRIDAAVIALRGKRFRYVRAAAPSKTDAAAVRAPKRFTAMLEQRRVWAAQQGLSPDVIEQLYRDLVECSSRKKCSTDRSAKEICHEMGQRTLFGADYRRLCVVAEAL